MLGRYDGDPAINNNAFETALTIASDNRDDDIVELLAPETQKAILDDLNDLNMDPPRSPLSVDEEALAEHAEDILADDEDQENVFLFNKVKANVDVNVNVNVKGDERCFVYTFCRKRGRTRF